MNTSLTIRLGDIASARSGDKGNHANVGVVAGTPTAFQLLREKLTPAVVAEFFSGLDSTGCQRFLLPNVEAMNFVLYDALGGGASRSLRIDTQGKLLGTAILELPVEIERDGRGDEQFAEYLSELGLKT